MRWRAVDVEELPGFVRWATDADALPADSDPDAARAWFEPPVDWRLADDGDDNRRCASMRCLSTNGARPLAGVLTRWRWARGTNERRPALYGFCAEHMANYGVHVRDGRVLWLRRFHLREDGGAE